METLLNNFQFMLLIYSAIFSVIGSFLGFLLQTLVNYFLSNRGKVKVYVKSVYGKTTKKPWGFEVIDGDVFLNIPLWIELHNTKPNKQIVRNLNLVLYHKDRKIRNLIQFSHFNSKDETYHYGENGAYSFLIDSNTFKRYDLCFGIYRKEVRQDFDEIRISYYDTKDKYHETSLFKVDEPWVVSKNEIDYDWREVD